MMAWAASRNRWTRCSARSFAARVDRSTARCFQDGSSPGTLAATSTTFCVMCTTLLHGYIRRLIALTILPFVLRDRRCQLLVIILCTAVFRDYRPRARFGVADPLRCVADPGGKGTKLGRDGRAQRVTKGTGGRRSGRARAARLSGKLHAHFLL